MSKEDGINIQEAFLNHIRESRMPTTIFLNNGVKLQGRLTCFDDSCLTLTRDGVTQFVYQHAISTIMPGDDFQMSDIVGFEESESYLTDEYRVSKIKNELKSLSEEINKITSKLE